MVFPEKMSNNKVRKCPGKESFQRINYLHQAANAIATENKASNKASKMYTNLMITIGKKAVQRLDIDLKRTICKGCRSLLLAGVNCHVRIKKKKSRWTCLTCQTVKVFDLRNKNHQPWTQKKESIVEILDYSNDGNDEPKNGGNQGGNNETKKTDNSSCKE